MTTQLTSPQVAADRRADAALLGATAVGSAAAALRLLTEGALTPVFVGWLWAAVPALLILLAYLLTSSMEGKAGIRQQRGALAALTGLAALSIPFTANMPFSPIYGVALLLLAVRTRHAATAVVGVVTLLAPAILGALSIPQAALALGLLAVACVANAVRVALVARA